ncbi:MAG: aldehyde dehydrogenase family protein [Leucobacter sp.]
MTSDAIRPQQLINGQWRDGSGADGIDVFDPSTGERIAELAPATIADADGAVAAAKAAFESWSELSLARRVQYLYRMRQNLIDHSEELARTITRDQGKTLDEARGEVLRSCDFLEAAIAAPMLYGSTSGNIAGNLDYKHLREPLGVALAITPLNFPVMNPTLFVGWALVTGNTLVVKPSEQDPLASTHALQLLADGLPAGVLNVIQGRADVSQHLVSHPDVAAVSCITSTPVARSIHQTATQLGKRVQANGGAKNPIVIAADADLEAAAEGVITSAFGMAGQRCLAGTRIIAERPVYDELVERVAQLTDRLVLGSGLDPETTLCPVVSAAAKARITGMIDAAAEAGATLIRDGRGAEPQTPSAKPGGYYLGPTIIADLPIDHPSSCEEMFGPAIIVHAADSVDEAIAMANDTEFGNAASIWTASASTARRFERGIRSGNIGINAFPGPPANQTMGGLGASFFGESHICGDAPLRFYTEEKLVSSRW